MENKKYKCIKKYEKGDCVVSKGQKVELVGHIGADNIPCISINDGCPFAIYSNFDKYFKEIDNWKTKKEYIKTPNSCPKCYSINISAEDIEYIDGDTVIQNIECVHCEAKWRDIYKLVKYERRE